MQKRRETEKHSRSILKSITWRVTATLTTGILVWIFTRDLTIALSLAGVEVVIKIIIYYFHERAWNAVDWGKGK